MSEYIKVRVNKDQYEVRGRFTKTVVAEGCSKKEADEALELLKGTFDLEEKAYYQL